MLELKYQLPQFGIRYRCLNLLYGIMSWNPYLGLYGAKYATKSCPPSLPDTNGAKKINIFQAVHSC